MKSTSMVWSGLRSQICSIVASIILPMAGGTIAESRDKEASEAGSSKIDRPLHTLSDTLVDVKCVPFPNFYAIQQTGNVDAHYDAYGVFGLGWNPDYNSYPQWPEASFQTPSQYHIEYLFAGSFWIGGRIGSDTLVSAAIDGWQVAREMWPPQANGQYVPNVKPFRSVADVSLWSEATDTSSLETYPVDVVLNRFHRPFPISIVNRSHVWRASRTKDILIYDMLLRNEGSETIEDGYVGFYFDCDVGQPYTAD